MTLTLEQRIQNLEEAVTRIEATLGDWTTPPLLSKGEKPVELPNGRYNLKESDYQVHSALDALLISGGIIDQIRAEIAALAARPTGSVQTGGGTSLPLPAPEGAVAVREVRQLAGLSAMYSHGQWDLEAQTFNTPVAFMREVGIGGPPMSGHPISIRKGGEIVFASRVASANTQEKSGDKTRLGVFSFSEYDNGIRMVQNAVWHGGIPHRVADHIRILGMDSQGTVSKSDEDYSKPEGERGQLWIVNEDFDKHVIRITPCRAGWGVEVGCSTQTMNDHNPNPMDRTLPLVAPIMQTRDIQAP